MGLIFRFFPCSDFYIDLSFYSRMCAFYFNISRSLCKSSILNKEILKNGCGTSTSTGL